jgi:hypothetical protein
MATARVTHFGRQARPISLPLMLTGPRARRFQANSGHPHAMPACTSYSTAPCTHKAPTNPCVTRGSQRRSKCKALHAHDRLSTTDNDATLRTAAQITQARLRSCVSRCTSPGVPRTTALMARCESQGCVAACPRAQNPPNEGSSDKQDGQAGESGNLASPATLHRHGSQRSPTASQRPSAAARFAQAERATSNRRGCKKFE